ncbi:branched-chain amino acid transport system II carrier protein [Caviibacter abscessus]|uniref:branched-chain amino acid transport system II carrier protein n=1 Tax=Caviibacter abscessus TaxID=1766719 RepID=UPI00082DFA0C|nr:branched-chain amino acid transport system II carrier protein [Caviibacter abscessus]
MNETKNKFKTLIIGFALFAMFFGAGNVLLPPFIGLKSGSNFYMSIAGFILTGVGLPLLALLVVFYINGEYTKLFEPLGTNFSKFLLVAAFLTIGPAIAIPRTAATTFEVGIKPFFPMISPVIGGLIFFLINLVFVMKKSDVLDKIGSLLTPALILTTVMLIVKGIIKPIAPIGVPHIPDAFSQGFLEGYNTIDAVASVIFAGLVWNNLSQTIKNKEVLKKTSIKASFIAAIGLSAIYAGFIYLGATASTVFPQNIERTTLLNGITTKLLGNSGMSLLAIIVSLACLTTSIGLIVSVSSYFEKVLNYKVKYNVIVIFVVATSYIISQLGVDKIINYTIPILTVFYPLLIVVLFLTLSKANYKVYRYTTYTTFVFCIIDLLYPLPLHEQGFAWLIPTFIAYAILTLEYAWKKNR